jgi:hypothetical protein
MLDYALRQAINEREDELGFQLHQMQSRRKVLLTNVENSTAWIGLEMNDKKTKVMAF